MEAKEKILHSNYKKFGIKKTWTKKSKQAALNAMEEYADEKLRLHNVIEQRELLLSELVEWLVINTKLDMEKVSDFEERFKQYIETTKQNKVEKKKKKY